MHTTIDKWLPSTFIMIHDEILGREVDSWEIMGITKYVFFLFVSLYKLYNEKTDDYYKVLSKFIRAV